MSDVTPTSGGLVGPMKPTPAAVDLIGGSGIRTILPVPGASSAGAAAGVSPVSLLRALKRRLPLALGLALLVMGIASSAAWFLLPPPKFRTTALYHVQGQTPSIIFKTADGALEGADSYRRYQKTQIQLLKSRGVVSAAIHQPEVKKLRFVQELKDPVDWVLGSLTVQFPQDSEILEISMSGDDPVALAAVVNAIGQTYLDVVVGREQKERATRHDRLKELSKTYTSLLSERQKEIRDLAKTAGSGDRQTLVLKQQYQMDRLMAARKQLSDIQTDKLRITSILKVQRPEGLQETAAPAEAVAPGESANILEELIDQHPEVSALRDRLAAMQDRLASESAYTGRVSRKAGMDPALKSLRDGVEALRSQLRKKREAVRPIVLRHLREPRAEGTPSKSLSLQQQLLVCEELEKNLEAQIQELSRFDTELNQNTLDLQKLQDEFKQMQEAAEKINHEVEILNVELKAPPRIRLVEKADVPLTRDSKKWYMLFGMITVGSFAATLFAVAFLELQTRKVDTVDEVVVGLGLPVVGSLPILPARARQGGAVKHREKDRYWYNLLLESIDATRTMLMHAARHGSHRVVMITSALAGEGKTSLASHLATSLARSGQRTLLIDADLRRPSIHHLFDLTPEPGMSELLRGEAALEDVIASTSVEELKVITAGRCDHQTLRILSQGGMGSHFAGFKEAFDFVIVDTSPVLPVADASIIAQQVDAVLFSVLTDVSRKDKIQAAYQRLANLGVKVLGAVVTGAHDGAYGTHYYPGEVYGSPMKSQSTPSEAEAES